MGILFIFGAAFGINKPRLVRYVTADTPNERNFILVKKIVVDDPDPRNKFDLQISKDIEKIISEADFEDLCRQENENIFYHYRQSGRRYGFYKNQIKENLENGKTVFIVIRNKKVIRELKKDFSDHTIITIYIFMDEAHLEKGPVKLSPTQKEKHREAVIEFCTDPKFYDETLPFCSNEQNFGKLLDGVVEHHSKLNKNVVNNNAARIEPSVYKSGVQMKESYFLLYCIENELRGALVSAFIEVVGDNWWEEKISPEIKARIKNTEAQNRGRLIMRNHTHPIELASLGDLRQMLEANWECLECKFKQKNKVKVLQVLDDLIVLRNMIAHSYCLSSQDQLRLSFICTDILGMLRQP